MPDTVKYYGSRVLGLVWPPALFRGALLGSWVPGPEVELGLALAKALEILLQRIGPLAQLLGPRNALIRLALPRGQLILLGFELVLQTGDSLGFGVRVGHPAQPWGEAIGAR